MADPNFRSQYSPIHATAASCNVESNGPESDVASPALSTGQGMASPVAGTSHVSMDMDDDFMDIFTESVPEHAQMQDMGPSTLDMDDLNLQSLLVLHEQVCPWLTDAGFAHVAQQFQAQVAPAIEAAMAKFQVSSAAQALAALQKVLPASQVQRAHDWRDAVLPVQSAHVSDAMQVLVFAAAGLEQWAADTRALLDVEPIPAGHAPSSPELCLAAALDSAHPFHAWSASAREQREGAAVRGAQSLQHVDAAVVAVSAGQAAPHGSVMAVASALLHATHADWPSVEQLQASDLQVPAHAWATLPSCPSVSTDKVEFSPGLDASALAHLRDGQAIAVALGEAAALLRAAPELPRGMRAPLLAGAMLGSAAAHALSCSPRQPWPAVLALSQQLTAAVAALPSPLPHARLSQLYAVMHDLQDTLSTLCSTVRAVQSAIAAALHGRVVCEDAASASQLLRTASQLPVQVPALDSATARMAQGCAACEHIVDTLASADAAQLFGAGAGQADAVWPAFTQAVADRSSPDAIHPCLPALASLSALARSTSPWSMLRQDGDSWALDSKARAPGLPSVQRAADAHRTLANAARLSLLPGHDTELQHVASVARAVWHVLACAQANDADAGSSLAPVLLTGVQAAEGDMLSVRVSAPSAALAAAQAGLAHRAALQQAIAACTSVPVQQLLQTPKLLQALLGALHSWPDAAGTMPPELAAASLRISLAAHWAMAVAPIAQAALGSVARLCAAFPVLVPDAGAELSFDTVAAPAGLLSWAAMVGPSLVADMEEHTLAQSIAALLLAVQALDSSRTMWVTACEVMAKRATRHSSARRTAASGSRPHCALAGGSLLSAFIIYDAVAGIAGVDMGEQAFRLEGAGHVMQALLAEAPHVQAADDTALAHAKQCLGDVQALLDAAHGQQLALVPAGSPELLASLHELLLERGQRPAEALRSVVPTANGQAGAMEAALAAGRTAPSGTPEWPGAGKPLGKRDAAQMIDVLMDWMYQLSGWFTQCEAPLREALQAEQAELLVPVGSEAAGGEGAAGRRALAKAMAAPGFVMGTADTLPVTPPHLWLSALQIAKARVGLTDDVRGMVGAIVDSPGAVRYDVVYPYWQVVCAMGAAPALAGEASTSEVVASVLQPRPVLAAGQAALPPLLKQLHSPIFTSLSKWRDALELLWGEAITAQTVCMAAGATPTLVCDASSTCHASPESYRKLMTAVHSLPLVMPNADLLAASQALVTQSQTECGIAGLALRWIDLPVGLFPSDDPVPDLLPEHANDFIQDGTEASKKLLLSSEGNGHAPWLPQAASGLLAGLHAVCYGRVVWAQVGALPWWPAQVVGWLPGAVAGPDKGTAPGPTVLLPAPGLLAEHWCDAPGAWAGQCSPCETNRQLSVPPEAACETKSLGSDDAWVCVQLLHSPLLPVDCMSRVVPPRPAAGARAWETRAGEAFDELADASTAPGPLYIWLPMRAVRAWRDPRELAVRISAMQAAELIKAAGQSKKAAAVVASLQAKLRLCAAELCASGEADAADVGTLLERLETEQPLCPTMVQLMATAGTITPPCVAVHSLALESDEYCSAVQAARTLLQTLVRDAAELWSSQRVSKSAWRVFANGFLPVSVTKGGGMPKRELSNRAVIDRRDLPYQEIESSDSELDAGARLTAADAAYRAGDAQSSDSSVGSQGAAPKPGRKRGRPKKRQPVHQLGEADSDSSGGVYGPAAPSRHLGALPAVGQKRARSPGLQRPVSVLKPHRVLPPALIAAANSGLHLADMRKAAAAASGAAAARKPAPKSLPLANSAPPAHTHSEIRERIVRVLASALTGTLVRGSRLTDAGADSALRAGSGSHTPSNGAKVSAGLKQARAIEEAVHAKHALESDKQGYKNQVQVLLGAFKDSRHAPLRDAILSGRLKAEAVATLDAPKARVLSARLSEVKASASGSVAAAKSAGQLAQASIARQKAAAERAKALSSGMARNILAGAGAARPQPASKPGTAASLRPKLGGATGTGLASGAGLRARPAVTASRPALSSTGRPSLVSSGRPSAMAAALAGSKRPSATANASSLQSLPAFAAQTQQAAGSSELAAAPARPDRQIPSKPPGLVLSDSQVSAAAGKQALHSAPLQLEDGSRLRLQGLPLHRTQAPWQSSSAVMADVRGARAAMQRALKQHDSASVEDLTWGSLHSTYKHIPYHDQAPPMRMPGPLVAVESLGLELAAQRLLPALLRESPDCVYGILAGNCATMINELAKTKRVQVLQDSRHTYVAVLVPALAALIAAAQQRDSAIAALPNDALFAHGSALYYVLVRHFAVAPRGACMVLLSGAMLPVLLQGAEPAPARAPVHMPPAGHSFQIRDTAATGGGDGHAPSSQPTSAGWFPPAAARPQHAGYAQQAGYAPSAGYAQASVPGSYSGYGGAALPLPPAGAQSGWGEVARPPSTAAGAGPASRATDSTWGPVAQPGSAASAPDSHASTWGPVASSAPANPYGTQGGTSQYAAGNSSWDPYQ